MMSVDEGVGEGPSRSGALSSQKPSHDKAEVFDLHLQMHLMRRETGQFSGFVLLFLTTKDESSNCGSKAMIELSCLDGRVQ